MKFLQNQLPQELLRAYERRKPAEPSGLDEITVPAKTRIVQQEECPKYVFILLEGSVKVSLSTSKGTEYLVAIEGTGEILGEVEALTEEPAVCSVTSLSECTFARMTHDAYKKWLQEDYEFAALIHRISAFRLRESTKRAAIHLSYPMEYSILKILKLHADATGEQALDLSKEELANYLGTSVRSVNRILKELEKKNVLLPVKSIEIASMENLEQVLYSHEQ